MKLALVLAGVLLVGLMLYWLLVVTEGVYLGRRVVVWLYDLTAGKYDDIKQFDPTDERLSIALPLLRALDGLAAPFVLDVATGTGRVPLLMLAETGFRGRVIGLDPSRKMLACALEKVKSLPAGAGRRIDLVQQTAVPLPFPDHTFDAVSCLEALEFMPSDEAALREMVRVLRPGGLLMTSRRQGVEGRLFVGRFKTATGFEQLLGRIGLDQIRAHLWQIDYDMIMARKRVGSMG